MCNNGPRSSWSTFSLSLPAATNGFVANTLLESQIGIGTRWLTSVNWWKKISMLPCSLIPCFVSSLIWVPLISPSFCCRPGWLAFPRMMDGRPLTVMSCIWRMWSRCIARHTGIWMDRWMPSSIFGARPCAAASAGAWELLMDVDESRITDQDLTILTLDQKQCSDRLQLASLRELGSRLGML